MRHNTSFGGIYSNLLPFSVFLTTSTNFYALTLTAGIHHEAPRPVSLRTHADAQSIFTDSLMCVAKFRSIRKVVFGLGTLWQQGNLCCLVNIFR